MYHENINSQNCLSVPNHKNKKSTIYYVGVLIQCVNLCTYILYMHTCTQALSNLTVAHEHTYVPHSVPIFAEENLQGTCMSINGVRVCNLILLTYV